ncbi:hypothetical protein C8R46DRAFT_909197 [Mycena filopes]|nr:hypothetical protein C8R46DRAFT_909197 [Mycena filopes]
MANSESPLRQKRDNGTLDHQRLPTELWLEVFTHLDERSYTVSHAPFQLVHGVASEAEMGTAYASVVLVCRNWRVWAIGLLYRNIKILRPDRFLDVHREYKHWIQRAILPYSSTVMESPRSSSTQSTEILSLCPNLQMLVRPPHQPDPFQSLRFDFDTTCPPLLSLRRLDWWNFPEASRSGGINSLLAVLTAAPNLEYLFIGIVRAQFADPFYTVGAAQIDLPRLRTLRLSTATALLVRHIVTRWTLPALENLVLDTPIVGLGEDMMWDSLGPQLKVVEFGKHLRFLLNENLASCLRGCPSLRELDYYVFTTSLPEGAWDEHPSVTSIGIHLAEIPFLGAVRDEWEHLERHFEIFAGGMFPNLRQLRIYGPPEDILTDERFSALLQPLRDRACIVEIV